MKNYNCSSRNELKEWMGTSYIAPIAVTLLTNIHNTPMMDKSIEYKKRYGLNAIDFIDTRTMSKMLTKKFKTKQRWNQRVVGLLFAEKVEANLHYHGILDAKNLDKEELLKWYNRFWRLKYPAGDVQFTTVYDRRKWNSYSLKSSNFENAIFIPEVSIVTLNT